MGYSTAFPPETRSRIRPLAFRDTERVLQPAQPDASTEPPKSAEAATLRSDRWSSRGGPPGIFVEAVCPVT